MNIFPEHPAFRREHDHGGRFLLSGVYEQPVTCLIFFGARAASTVRLEAAPLSLEQTQSGATTAALASFLLRAAVDAHFRCAAASNKTRGLSSMIISLLNTLVVHSVATGQSWRVVLSAATAGQVFSQNVIFSRWWQGCGSTILAARHLSADRSHHRQLDTSGNI